MFSDGELFMRRHMIEGISEMFRVPGLGPQGPKMPGEPTGGDG